MGTNKTVEILDTPFGSKLRIKTKDQPLAPERRDKLVNALVLANEVVFHAGARLIRNAPTPLEQTIYAAHFKSDLDPSLEDRQVLRRNFMALRNALRGDLTIADAYSSVGKQELRTAAQKLYQERMELQSAYEGSKVGFSLGIDSLDDVLDAGSRLDAFDSSLADRVKKSAKAAHAQARNEMGYVKPHKPFAAFRTPSSGLDSLPLEPAQWGSIHINFQILLTTKRTTMEVAATIIHEASHKILDALDFAYVYESKYQTMTTEEALRNADSYAFAAASLARGRLIKSQADLY
jgi:hypothetical protein